MSQTTDHIQRTERAKEAELDLRASIYEFMLNRMQQMDEDTRTRIEPDKVLRKVAEEFAPKWDG